MGAGFFDGFAVESGGDGGFEIVGLGSGAGFAEGDVAVVDAAAVGEVAGVIEDGGLGGDGGFGTFDEEVLGITDRGAGEFVL